MPATVALTVCNTYAKKELAAAIRKVFTLAPLPDIKGKKVLLKPNILSDASPEKALTTRPEFVREVILYFQERGASIIYVGDSPGLPGAGFKGEKCGIGAVVRETGALWANFSKEKVTVSSPTAKVQKEFKVTSFVDKVDMIISLPKLKTHQLMFFTGAVKNLFGLVPGLTKSPFHVRYPDRNAFGEMILDLYEAIMPSYAVMDGIIGMEGPGPANGTPHPVKVILGSTNLVALDIIASTIIGYDPLTIPINALALKRNFGIKTPTDITIAGVSIDEVKTNTFKLIPNQTHPYTIFNILKNSKFIQRYTIKHKPKPYFIEEKCIKCGKCIEICASNANWFEEGPNGKFVAVDYNRCIRCYCCHEVCPADAIEIR